MKNDLGTLKSRKKVRILYRGSVKAEIIPGKGKSIHKTSQHPIFGMLKGEKGDTVEIVSTIRRCRNRGV
jgi:hypothetical protein